MLQFITIIFNKVNCFFFQFNVIMLQSVEEAECRKAYDSAAEVYMSSFDRTKPADEVSVTACMASGCLAAAAVLF